jgi:hypothetical protein
VSWGARVIDYFELTSSPEIAGCIGFIDPYVYPAMKAAGQ